MRAEDVQFKFDYRPVIWLYSLYCIWQGLFWFLDPPMRFTAPAFYQLRVWAATFGLDPNWWGIPMVVAGVLIFGGMLIKIWQVRWVGYFIASITFLCIAESMRQSGVAFPTASQTGVRSYVFIGLLPVVLAVVAQVHAHDRKRRESSP